MTLLSAVHVAHPTDLVDNSDRLISIQAECHGETWHLQKPVGPKAVHHNTQYVNQYVHTQYVSILQYDYLRHSIWVRNTLSVISEKCHIGCSWG